MSPQTLTRLEAAGERLALGGQELHCGDPIEVPLRHLDRWVPATVEWSPSLGWYALPRRGEHDHRDLAVPLHPGSPVRPIRDRGYSR